MVCEAKFFDTIDLMVHKSATGWHASENQVVDVNVQSLIVASRYAMPDKTSFRQQNEPPITSSLLFFFPKLQRKAAHNKHQQQRILIQQTLSLLFF